jgi:hypothetical protein
MRPLTTQEAAVLAAPSGYSVALRVSIKDVAGTWRDLTALHGHDFVEAVEHTYDIDDQAPSAVITLRREVAGQWLSLAPLMGASRLNNGGPLLRPGAEVRVETATLPRGAASAGDWQEVFRGLVDSVESAAEAVVLSCRDKIAASLQQQWVTGERLYSDATGILSETLLQAYLDDWYCGLPRQASTAYLVGDRIRASPAGVFGYRCTVAGTTGSGSGPAFPTTPGAIVVDGTVTWRCIGPTILLRTPSASSWAVRGPFKLDKQPLYEALKEITDQNGWALRILWHPASNACRLTYLEPHRTATVPAWTFGPDAYLDVTELDQDKVDVRNFVRVIFSDRLDLDLTGHPKRKTVQVVNVGSAEAYQEGFLEISEDSTSQIDTATQALAFANAVLADLKEPKAALAIECPYAFHLELGDLIGFEPNSVHFDTAQTLAVVSLRHVLTRDRARTVVMCRGTPAAQYAVWLERAAAPGQAAPAPFEPPAAPVNVQIARVLGGVVVTWDFAPTGVPAVVGEVHVYTSSGATLTSSTLRGTVAGQRLEVGDLLAGVTYYAKVVPVDAAGNRGTASAEVSTAAGHVSPLALQPVVAFGSLPPNPDFEAVNASGAPPDTWTMVTGTWGVDADTSTSTVYSGGRSLRFPATAVQTRLASQLFAVTPGLDYMLRALMYAVTTPGATTVQCELRFYSDLGVTEVTPPVIAGGPGIAGVWFDSQITGQAPAGARYARVYAGKANSLSFEAFVDAVFVVQASFRQRAWSSVAGALLGTWTAGTTTPRYRLTVSGDVALSGRVTGGTLNTAAFNLPAGLRPAATRRFAVAGGTLSPHAVRVDTNGNVVPEIGSTTDFCFDGVLLPLD